MEEKGHITKYNKVHQKHIFRNLVKAILISIKAHF